MKEDSAVLYEELLKGLDKVKAKAENEAANGSIESPILKSSNSHIKKRKERKSQFENNNVEDKENFEKTSSEVSINEDIEELYDERDEIANLANKKSLKKPLINNKDINLLKENNDIVNYNSQRAVIKNKDDKNFWEKLYICGASFIFIISCFLISLFVLTFSFLFYLHIHNSYYYP